MWMSLPTIFYLTNHPNQLEKLYADIIIQDVRENRQISYVYQYRQSRLVMMLTNTLRLRQNGRRFADDTFKCILLNESYGNLIKISPKFVSNGPISKPRRQAIIWTDDGWFMHICGTRLQSAETITFSHEICGHIIIWAVNTDKSETY